ncbi:g12435 [Coccomyxa viridis]|uniref:G12435 protein n=1 Tax=Coccomyxa viridis TaxID=1274662 RepID=A0ABP1GAB7_9CHLO
MTEAAPDKVQIKYTQQYRELKQILLAKHFAGQGVQKKVDVDGLEITFTEGPPLKKFVTPPKLSEDLAKYLEDK